MAKDHAALLSVHVTPDQVFKPSAPSVAFPIRLFAPIQARNYDISPDGKRFVFIEDMTASDPQSAMLTVFANWAEELKRLVPVK